MEVVDTFTKFDRSMIATVEAKEISHFERVLDMLGTLSTYYDGYYEMAAIVLNYEEFLHNVNTREAIAECIKMRTNFVRKELKAAMDEGEIIDVFTSEELSNLLLGSLNRDLLNRRIQNDSKSHSQVAMATLNKLAGLVRVKGDS